MVRIPLPGLALTGVSLLFNAEASAQTPPPAPSAPSAVKSPADAEKPAARPAPLAVAAPPKPPAKAQPRKAVATRRKGKGDKAQPVLTGAVATSPGFRMLEEGKSRVFLEVNQKVEVTERKAKGRVVYRLKGAAVPTRNSRLPLPTGFFATPVGQVELIDQGDGADLVIELREAAEPAYRVIETPRGIVLQVDFPRASTDHPAEQVRRGGSGKHISSGSEPE